MFVIRKIWRALFSWNTRFEIHPSALLPRKNTQNDNLLLALQILSIYNVELQRKANIKSFGAHFDDNLTWKDHINTIGNKISKNIGLIIFRANNMLNHITLTCIAIYRNRNTQFVLYLMKKNLCMLRGIFYLIGHITNLYRYFVGMTI